MSSPRVALAGSAPKSRPGETWLGPADPNQQITVTIHLRRPEGSTSLAASPADLQAVESFAEQYGLQVVSANPDARTIHLAGSVQQMDTAFGVELGMAQDQNGESYVTYRGNLTLPANLAPAVVAVLGLDTRRVARHHA